MSELARRGLSQQQEPGADVGYSPFPVTVGDPDAVVTDELIAEHRDA